MKFIAPNSFDTGRAFRRSRMKEHVEAVVRDLEDVRGRRYTYSSFTLDFGQLATGDDAEEGVMYVKPPSADLDDWEIVSAEFMAAKASATSRDYTLVISDGSASKTLTNTIAAADTLTRVASAVDMQVAAGTEVSFTVSGFATEQLDACKVVVHIRYDRCQDASTTALRAVAPVWRNMDNGSVMSSFFSADSTQSVLEANSYFEELRIQVLGWRNPGLTFAAEEDVHEIPSCGLRLAAYSAYVIRDGSGSGERITATLADENASTVATINIDPSGASSTASTHASLVEVQTVNDPDDPSDNYTITWTETGSGDIKRAYVVLYWEA